MFLFLFAKEDSEFFYEFAKIIYDGCDYENY